MSDGDDGGPARLLATGGSRVSVLAYKLREMAENLSVDLGPSEDDRELLLEAAELLEHLSADGAGA